jgi:diadenosine tetraphosphate (Ap4A) HIT family hydrolase
MRDNNADAAARPVDIPSWKQTPDYFVWEAFDQASYPTVRVFGPEATQQEALLAETERFYVIPDQFGVVSGHLLVIPKERAASIACLDTSVDDEIGWLLETVSTIIAEAYQGQVVVAEHGDCGCASASQAHVHVLPVPMTLDSARLRGIIDEVLRRRMIGIERITYRHCEFTELEDLQALMNVDGASITGRLLQCSDLVDHGTYPASARTVSELEHPYVYFRGPGIRFVRPCSFRSQFVREVVSIAANQLPGTWDRRVNTSRRNMFESFQRLAPAFSQRKYKMYGYKRRVGVVAAPRVDNTVVA